MLKVAPKTLSYVFSVVDGAKAVAQVEILSWRRDRSELRMHDDIYTAYRDKSCYVLESTQGVLVRAERQRRWSRRLVIEHSGRAYTLCAKSAFHRQLMLLDGSTQVGCIAPKGIFTGKAAAEFPHGFPLFLQVFIIWLAMTLWKYEDSAAAY
ncbi:MAG: hypothetical protein QM808_11360 [Steroidobacteraceae bacterium]